MNKNSYSRVIQLIKFHTVSLNNPLENVNKKLKKKLNCRIACEMELKRHLAMSQSTN